MTKTETRRDDHTTGTMKQIAYYTGAEVGEEAVDWSQEYNFAGTTVKTTTMYDRDTDGMLLVSTVYKDDAVRDETWGKAVSDLGDKKSATFYERTDKEIEEPNKPGMNK